MLVTMATQPLVSPGDQQLCVWTANTQALYLFGKMLAVSCGAPPQLHSELHVEEVCGRPLWFTLKKKKKKQKRALITGHVGSPASYELRCNAIWIFASESGTPESASIT